MRTYHGSGLHSRRVGYTYPQIPSSWDTLPLPQIPYLWIPFPQIPSAPGIFYPQDTLPPRKDIGPQIPYAEIPYPSEKVPYPFGKDMGPEIPYPSEQTDASENIITMPYPI